MLIPDGPGILEHCIDRILDERRVGRRRQCLVRWTGFGTEDDEWLPRKALKDCKALDVWERSLSRSSYDVLHTAFHHVPSASYPWSCLRWS